MKRWRSLCILEHLLADERKAKKVAEVLAELGLTIKPYKNDKWFDIVKAEKK